MPLTKKEIQNVINMVNWKWRDYVISEEMMKKPTTSFVTDFYCRVVRDIEATICFITKDQTRCLEILQADLSADIKLYRNLVTLIPTIKNTDFKLGDILNPTPLRTNRYMLLCMHFIIFINEKAEPAKEVVAKSMLKRESIEQTEAHNQQLLLQIATTSEKLGIELDGLQRVKDEHKQVKQERKLKKESYMKVKTEADNLQTSYDNQQAKLKKLEETEQQLQEQIVTEEEQQHLRQTKANLLMDVENLKSTNAEIGDGFHEQRETIKHFQNCLRLLKNLHMTSNISNLHKMEQQLMNEEQELCNITKNLEQLRKTKRTIQKQKAQLDQNIKLKSDETTKLENELSEMIKQLEDLAKKTTTEYTNVKKREAIVGNLEGESIKNQAAIEKLEKAFDDKFTSMKQKREHVVNIFSETLSKYKEN